MKFRDFLQQNIVCFDGGTGTLLQAQGLRPGELPERWNLTRPEVLIGLHQSYFDAGSNVVCTNTFGANLLKFDEDELDGIVAAAIRNARTAAQRSAAPQEKFVALDIGPSGKLLKPLGDLDFEDAVRLFAATVKLGVQYGADLILIETMNDSYETKAALLAAKENSDLPVVVSNAYGQDGKLMTGATPAAMVALLEGMGAEAIGANCSLGPAQLAPVVEELLENASVPVLLKPNAGLPRSVDGETVFDVSAEDFSCAVRELVEKGVRLVGGCCGTTPDYIRRLHEKIAGLSPLPVIQKHATVVSSFAKAVTFGADPLLIGERINPTGKKRFKEALLAHDLDYLLSEGVAQEERGAHILDVNVGLPGIDERAMLTEAVCALQAVVNVPLQIDTSDLSAMEAALRRYNGKAIVNSVSGKEESMKAVFPLMKKYGGVAVALTLDERGIPETAEGRVEIAKKILAVAAEYGIDKKDVVFDTLTMAVSAKRGAADVTLSALRTIREELGCHTLLGVSNISFGLPARERLNGTFFAMALQSGLSAAIMNPYSEEMMGAFRAYRALRGLDKDFGDYIAAAEAQGTAPAQKPADSGGLTLSAAIEKGLKEQAAACAKQLLSRFSPMEIVNGAIIPALNAVGAGFEKKRVYLPQLLMTAEAAKRAFEVVRNAAKTEQRADQGKFVIATVRGDIHDIGKNIVKLLLENYGFDVYDLGKDVPCETVAEKTVETHAPLVGLSALMTTTVPAMEETIRLLRRKAPWCRIVVGGAVLTEDYAKKIGADFYARDAMETVRFAQRVTAGQE